MLSLEIEGRRIKDVFRLPRDLVRDQETVWVMKDGKLVIRNVVITFTDAKYAYISEGLHDGDEVVTTTLATVAEGIGLRKVSASPTDSSDANVSDDGNTQGSTR